MFMLNEIAEIDAQKGSIQNVLDELISFIPQNNLLGEDFEEYKKTLNLRTEKLIQSEILTYLLDRKINGMSIFQILKSEFKNLSKDKKRWEIFEKLENSFELIFEVKKRSSKTIQVYSPLNEKNYNLISCVNLNEYRDLNYGHFFFGKIVKYVDNYFLIQIKDQFESSARENVQKYCIGKILENSDVIYFDNEEKLIQLKQVITKMHSDMIECFSDFQIVIASNKVKQFLNILNTFELNSHKPDCNQIEELLWDKLCFNYNYLQQGNFDYNNFLEKSLLFFDENIQNEVYDVMIIADDTLGLFAIPFLGTFCSIFQDSISNFENIEKCVTDILSSKKIPVKIFRNIYERFSNFIQRINEILKTDYNDFESLMQAFGRNLNEDLQYSKTSVLYCCKIFEQSIEKILNDEHSKKHLYIDYSKVGRNDKCPCGSGKKYKNCCLKR